MSRQFGSWGRRCKRGAPYLPVVLLGAPRQLVVLFIMCLMKSAVLESSGGQREDNRFNIIKVSCSCAGNSTKQMDIKLIRKRACAAIALNSSANARTREFAARTRTALTFSWRIKGREGQSQFVLKFERDPSEKNSRPLCFLVQSKKRGCNKNITCSAKSQRKGVKVTVLPSRVWNTSLKTRQGADKARIFKNSRKNLRKSYKQKSQRSITQECDEWTPQLHWQVNGRDVNFSYSPINNAADRIIIELTQNYMVKLSRNVSHKVQEIVFHDVPPGNYSVEIQPQGAHCSKNLRAFTHSKMLIIPQPNARPLTGSKPINNTHPTSVTEKPCSHWNPNVEAALYINEGVAVVQVKYKPANPNANDIHIVLEKNDTHTQVEKILKSSETWTSFTNVTPGPYNVLVGSSCTDCKDFHQTGRLCFTAYTSGNPIVVPPEYPEGVDSTPGDDPTGTIVRTAHSIGANSTSGHSTPPKTVSPINPVTPENPVTPANPITTENPTKTKNSLWAIFAVLVVIFAAAFAVIVHESRRRVARNRSRPELDAGSYAEESDSDSGHDSDSELGEGMEMGGSDETFLKIKVTGEPCVVTGDSNYNAVLLVYIENNDASRKISFLLAEVLKRLGLVVKMDRLCQKENESDVLGWADRMLTICQTVVVIVSENLVKTCKSYKNSGELRRNSKSAYNDIAPHVMTSLAGNGYGRTVFITFDAEEGCGCYQELLALYKDVPRGSWERQDHSLGVWDVQPPPYSSLDPASMPCRIESQGTNAHPDSPEPSLMVLNRKSEVEQFLKIFTESDQEIHDVMESDPARKLLSEIESHLRRRPIEHSHRSLREDKESADPTDQSPGWDTGG